MRFLLDTHTFLWWVKNDPALSKPALNAIVSQNNDIFVSAATAWEIATKHRIGKLPNIGTALAVDIEGVVANEGFSSLAVSVRHGEGAGRLPGQHRDPFDRMLVAQAMMENLVLISNERVLDQFGVKRLW